jgi:hypothetical protein
MVSSMEQVSNLTFLARNGFFEYRFNIAWNTLNMPTVEGGDPAPLRNMDYIFVLGMFI